MKASASGATKALVKKLKDDLAELVAQATSVSLSTHARKRLDADVREVMSELGELIQELDPIRRPAAVFDPSNPKVIGRFVALGLVAQPRQTLASIEPFYGSGVYAIYYIGKFPRYAPLSRTETPIYVGQASPVTSNARTVIEQGNQLSKRLKDHCRNIKKASSTLSIEDFECRTLVVQSGWESAAEDYLIQLFRPIWNNETGILYGIGKHGDRATTRTNKRSPWDTLHEGRQWAAETKEDARSLAQIEADLKDHFSTTTIYKKLDDVLRDFVEELRQI